MSGPLKKRRIREDGVGGDSGIKSHLPSSYLAHCIQVVTNKSGQTKSNLEFSPLRSLGLPALDPSPTLADTGRRPKDGHNPVCDLTGLFNCLRT